MKKGERKWKAVTAVRIAPKNGARRSTEASSTGQIRGIRGMVEKDAYCIDILTQASAAAAALNAFSKELLAEHIRTCVAQDIRAGKDETIDELVNTLQKLMK